MRSIKVVIILVFSIFLKQNLKSAELNFITNNDSLINSNDAVVLLDNHTFNVNDEFSGHYFIHKKILIKNENAEKYCNAAFRESEFVEVEDIEAQIVSLDGNVLKELDNDDLKEEEISINNFYSGAKYYYFKLTYHTYPYILEYWVEKEINSLFFWPNWFPQNDIPTICSSYKLINKSEVEFSYKSIGIAHKPEFNNSYGYDEYYWELSNIPKRITEDYLPPENKIQLATYFKANDFILGDYKGDTKSWDGYAKFYRKLAHNRYELPLEAKLVIKNLIQHEKSDEKKVSILYKHLQNTTRYVDIEMGINGWQPSPADQVYNRKYGDCKDLSTLMVSMLKIADIKSYPALALTSSSGKIIKDFPSNQFNHVIVMVPLEKDTIWLECTSSYYDMKDIPYNIEGIDVLVITDTGGKIVKTTQKESMYNFSKSTISGELELNGDLNYNAIISTTGNRKNYTKMKMLKSNVEEEREFLEKMLNDYYSSVIVEKYNIKMDKNDDEYCLEVNGRYKGFAPSRGKRIFINPAIYNRKLHSYLPEESESERNYPIYFRFPYVNSDSVQIQIADQYNVESIPQNKLFEDDYIKYTANFEVDQNVLKYSRYFELKQNLIPLEKYSEFLKIYRKIIKSDKSKFVIIKN